MDFLQQTYFSDILHVIAQALLLPAVIALIALVVYALWCIGSVLVEWRTENAHFRVSMPDFLDDISEAAHEELPYVVANSGLLGRQKRTLLTLWDYRNLPVDSHVALAKRLIEEHEDRHMKVLQRTQTVSKIAPMLGLMGTLIPLGPGLISLGQGDTLTLSASLLVAFDTTVAGLVVALVTYVITKIRQRWYDNYMSALEASSTAILEKVDAARETGTLDTERPTHFLADLDSQLVSGEQRVSRPRANQGDGPVVVHSAFEKMADGDSGVQAGAGMHGAKRRVGRGRARKRERASSAGPEIGASAPTGVLTEGADDVR